MDQKNISQISSVLQLPSFFKLSTLSVPFGSKCLSSSQLSPYNSLPPCKVFKQLKRLLKVSFCLWQEIQLNWMQGWLCHSIYMEEMWGKVLPAMCVHLWPGQICQILLNLPKPRAWCLCLTALTRNGPFVLRQWIFNWKKGLNWWFNHRPFYFLFLFRKIEVLNFCGCINNAASSPNFFFQCKESVK